jgi:hypothetical protein
LVSQTSRLGIRPALPDLPGFLQGTTWVEFSKSIDDEEALHRLECGIKGIQPGRRTIIQLGECPYVGLRDPEYRAAVMEMAASRVTQGLARLDQKGWIHEEK